jgi:hypothetical protein
MSGWNDLEGVTTPRISEEDVERLLSGMSAQGDLGHLDDLFGALRGQAEPDELAGLEATFVAFGAAGATTRPDSATSTRPMTKKIVTGKALAIIGVLTFVSAGAAAASGVVPTPFSTSKPVAVTTTITVVAAVPADVADEADATPETHATHETDAIHETDETVADETSIATTSSVDEVESDPVVEPSPAVVDAADGTAAQGPDVNGPAKFGLCTAYDARSKNDEDANATEPAEADAGSGLPVPFQALNDAALAAGQSVADFCAEVEPGHSADAPGQSADDPSTTAPGKSDDKPSTTAPGHSGNSAGKHGRPEKTD